MLIFCIFEQAFPQGVDGLLPAGLHRAQSGNGPLPASNGAACEAV